MFAGSFDPPHSGHMDIIGKCNMMFDKVIVAIGVNEQKTYTYPLEKRLEMLHAACRKYDNVEVTSFDGWLADFMKSVGTPYYVRGIRDQKDYEYEKKNFEINVGRNEDIQTIFVPCSKEVGKISSTLIRQRLKAGESVTNLVPFEILGML